MSEAMATRAAIALRKYGWWCGLNSRGRWVISDGYGRVFTMSHKGIIQFAKEKGAGS